MIPMKSWPWSIARIEPLVEFVITDRRYSINWLRLVVVVLVEDIWIFIFLFGSILMIVKLFELWPILLVNS